MRRDGRDVFWGKEKKGLAQRVFRQKKILFIMENPVIMSSIMYIRSDR